MNVRPVCVESATLRAVATLNGRARCPVFLYRKTDAAHAIATDELNIASSSARAGFVELLPDELRVEVATLLAQLAAVAAAESAKPKGKEIADVDPFPAVDPWDTPVAGDVLLDELLALIRAYVVLPEYGAEVLALWIVHTYSVDVADFTPYLLLTSPVRECGKSTTLDLIVHVAHRAQQTGGITAAALYRRIDRHAPAMLLDELDTRLRGDSGELLRGVLNTGFHRSGRITICVGDDHDEKDFSTFCPKVLAGIGRVWDTVASRSIPLRLNRATKEQLATLTKIRGDRISATCEPFRRKLSRFADDNRNMLRIADPVTPGRLSARQGDVWRPLLAIADCAGGHWPETARTAAVTVHGIAEDEGDLGLLLLQDINDLFVSQATGLLPSAEIVRELGQREDRPWPEYRHGSEITARGVAALLGRFGVKPKTHRSGATTVKGYSLAQLQPAFDTYLAPLPADLSVTNVTGPVVTDVTDRNGGGRPQAWAAVPDGEVSEIRRVI